MFLGSISYLSGSINSFDKSNLVGNRYKNFFSEASLLKIFSRPFQTSLGWKDSKVASNSLSFKLFDRRTFLDQLKKYVREKILDKFKSVKSNLESISRKIEGYFLYKWIKENTLLVAVKFKLSPQSGSSWYYDQFSVTLKH